MPRGHKKGLRATKKKFDKILVDVRDLLALPILYVNFFLKLNENHFNCKKTSENMLINYCIKVQDG